ncbi:MAG: class I SAM-dependent methyltransferase [Ilumatobacter sp.]|nr:class I SAM-dependent methyltransferase [Ilumatobacter sp.]
MFDDAIVAPTVELLADLAGGGRALEFAVGTGRIALPLAAAGLDVSGIELSEPMIAELRTKPGGADIPVVVGDMASTRVEGQFALVFLVFNTIMNVTTQQEQVAVFRNAAAHLAPGGRFAVEVAVPRVGGTESVERRRVFTMSDEHVGIETFDDPVGQISSSHHWLNADGRLVRRSAPYRYVYPPELDLMAQLAGLELEHRWAGWDRSEFTADSTSHVSVWRLP